MYGKFAMIIVGIVLSNSKFKRSAFFKTMFSQLFSFIFFFAILRAFLLMSVAIILLFKKALLRAIAMQPVPVPISKDLEILSYSQYFLYCQIY
jgi:hypothetical protein